MPLSCSRSQTQDPSRNHHATPNHRTACIRKTQRHSPTATAANAAASAIQAISLSTPQHASEHIRPVAEPPLPHGDHHPVRHATAARPETHQNLIHIDKEHLCQRTANGAGNHDTRTATCPDMRSRTLASPRSSNPANQAHPIADLEPPSLRGPGGGDRVRTDDPLLAKQVLSQLSYAPKARSRRPARKTLQRQPHGPATMVGQGGFEPPTPRLSSVCSNQLSY